MRIADVFIALLADGTKLAPQVEEEAAKAGDAGAKTLGQRLKKGLSAERIGTAMGAALGGIAAAGAMMGEKVDNALDTIRTGTGKTGDALKGLEDDFKAVSSRVPDDLEQVGQVIADLNTRTGQTGEGLQELAVSILDFSRLTKTDVNVNVRNATRLFGDWSIATEDQAATLDKVYRASQATGIGVDSLMEKVVDFGSPLRLLGFQFEESIAMLSKWEKEGVNTETALTGLKFSVKTLAREGVAASDMAETLQKRIAAIAKSADPVGESIKLFGLRAGPDLAAAILEGRFATEDLLEVINNGSDTIQQATEDTQGFGEAFAKASNWIQTSLGGMLTAFAGLGNLVYLFPVIGGAFGKLAGRMVGGMDGAWRTVGRSPIVARAIAIASSKAATLYLAGLIAGDKISAVLSSAFGKLPLGPIAAAGTKAGAAFSAAMSAAILAVPVVVTYVMVEDNNQRRQEQQAALSEAVQKVIAEGTLDGLQKARKQLEQQLAFEKSAESGISGWVRGLFGGEGQTAAVQADLDAIIAAIEAKSREIPAAVGSGIASNADAVTPGMRAMGASVLDSVDQVGPLAKALGQKIPPSIAEGILAEQSEVVDAMGVLTHLMENELTPAQEIARNIGILTSKELAAGLKDKRPAVRQEAERVQAVAEQRLAELIAGGGKVGKKASAELAAGLKSKNATVRASAQRVKDIVTSKLNETKGPAGKAGTRAGTAFLSNLRAKLKSATIVATFRTQSAATGTTFGYRAAGGPTQARTPYWVNEHTPRTELFVPSTSGYVMTNAQAVRTLKDALGGGRGGGDTYNIPMTVQGALPVRTIRDISRETQRAARMGAVPPRTLAPQYPRREATR